MKILIAEDEKISRMVLIRTLEKRGYEVLSARDGQEGWEIFQKEKENISIAILDWMMPGMDGLELCRRIKEAAISHYVYVIFLTGKRDIEDIVEGLETGADDYLTKPFDKRELFSRVEVGQRIVDLEKALQESNRKLHEMAVTDSLTGIFNRRAILERLGDELSRAGREKPPLCLMMLDIDHFKRVNDEHGHAVGDKVLVEVVNRVNSQLRPYDVMGRYGGEEFLLGMPGADPENSRKIAERIRTSICEKPFETDDKKLNVSISLGVTSIVPSRDSDTNNLLEAVIKTADDALYKAKETGRNRVVYG
ncbi:MAG: diguanylate cyclase [Thermodesulfobacteriota bacterium]|nr:diguanylate cyclase [Thermodesulfobacteriota bacterium]